MKATLSTRILVFCTVFATALLGSVPAFSQAWTFRNGFGQSGASNGLADLGRAVCVDAAGNVYITGKISDDLTGNTVSFGGAALVSAGDDDGFVAKFNSAGVHQWSLRFGGPLLDEGGYGIATDGTSVYVVGEANGTMTVGTSATGYPAVGGGIDGFVMKLDAATGATVSWVTRFGGANSDRAQAVTLDPSGNIYLSGIFRTRAANPNATFGSFTRTVQGNTTAYTSDLFAAAMNTSGTFLWVSTGGAGSANDNIIGSGICYVPALTEVIVTGSYRSATGVPASTTATYSTTTPVSSVTLNNASGTTNEDFCLLEINATNGAFVSGSGVGAGDGNEAGLAITYDSYTGDVFFAGYFGSASTTFPGNPANTNGSATHDNILYGRYNPSTNAYVWTKDVDNSVPASAADVARAITSDGLGGVLITGNFRNTATFPGGSTVVGSGVQSDIFLARINVATGNAILVTQGVGTSATADDIGNGIAYATNGSNIWITGQYASSVTFAPLAALASNNGKEDVLLVKFSNPPPVINTQPLPSTACAGLPVSFTVVASGPGLLYQWQESADASFNAPVNLTNANGYSNVTTATLNIADNALLNGKYYRVVVSNSGGTVNSNAVLLTVTAPTLPTTHQTATQNVNTNNGLFYGTACQLIAKILPSGGTPITGSVTADVWREGAVSVFGTQPYVQRHYQATVGGGSTATVTLYFSQADFDNFNAHPGSGLNLPANPSDATGKSNLRVTKFNGTSSNGTGLPGTYPGAGTLINPGAAAVNWNATYSRWEVSFAVTGFSGFFVHASDAVLPVNLISFSGQVVNNDVQLKWQTSAENNNDRFEVERSLDGRSFTMVGKRAGNNGAGVVNYDLLDANAALLNASKLYYRLKIVGQAGDEEYSNTIIVEPGNQNFGITSVNPNPFTNRINLNFSMQRATRVTLKLTDITGRVLRQEYVQAVAGFSTYAMKGLENLSGGIYFLSAEFDGQIFTRKVKK